jgi:hypothetical protein
LSRRPARLVPPDTIDCPDATGFGQIYLICTHAARCSRRPASKRDFFVAWQRKCLLAQRRSGSVPACNAVRPSLPGACTKRQTKSARKLVMKNASMTKPRRRHHLIAAWPKSGNQHHPASLPFHAIAPFKHEAGRNGTCDTSIVAAPMCEKAMLDMV